MTGSRGKSPERIITQETKEANKSSEKSTTLDTIRSGARLRPSDTSNTLETKLYSLEEKNQRLNDIKRIKQCKEGEETQLYKARATMVEKTARYEGISDEKPDDSDIAKLASHSEKFLECISTLDDIDIKNSNSFIKAINAYQEAKEIANNTEYHTLEEKEIRNRKLDETKTIREIWKEIKFSQYDYSNITENSLREARVAFQLIKGNTFYTNPERLVAQEISEALYTYATGEPTRKQNFLGWRRSRNYINNQKPEIPSDPKEAMTHAMRYLDQGYQKYKNGHFKSGDFGHRYRQLLKELGEKELE